MLAVVLITFFFVADVQFGLYEINKKQQSKCYTWTESGTKNF